MPRRARLILPGLPLHVTQRGVNRGAIFVDDDDRQHYRRLLRKSCDAHAVAIHAYVLMDNHVHLLATPARAESMAKAMRSCGQTYVRHFNERHGRCGALWQERFGSSPIESDRHLLVVLRYVELNPVRAGMVTSATDHAWSSVHVHLGRRSESMLTPHPSYLALGATPSDRASAYAALLAEGLTYEQTSEIRKASAQQRPFGSERFKQMLEKTLGLPTRLRGDGRPRSPGKS
jgi:putative transposase